MHIFDIGRRLAVAERLRCSLRTKYGQEARPKKTKDWGKVLSLREHFASTRSSEDASCVAFSGNLDIVGRNAECFVKIAYKNASDARDAAVERRILENDIRRLVSRALTPCLPLCMGTFRVKNDTGIMNWKLYGEVLEQIKKEGIVRDLNRRRFIDLLVTEHCGKMTLREYLLSRSTNDRNELPCIFLMLFHALEILSEHGICHGDMHFKNIVLCEVPPTVVSFDGRVFETTLVPIIVDWDIARTSRVKNTTYSHVGIFNEQDPLFDLYGVLRTLFYTQMQSTHNSRREGAIITCPETKKFLLDITHSLREAKRRHPWLFKLEFQDEDGHTVKCVQQTPYVPAGGRGRPVKWPKDVKEVTPSFRGLRDIAYKAISRTEGGVVNGTPAFYF